MFFVNIKILFLLITTAKKIIVVAIFVNFLRIFKVYNLAHFHRMGRVGLWRHFGNNNVSFLRRIYSSNLVPRVRDPGNEVDMRVCDSVCQNRCRMQGICVVGDCSNTGYAAESIPLYSIPLSRWNSTRNEKKTKEVGWSARSESRGASTGSRRGFLRSRVCRHYKKL